MKLQTPKCPECGALADHIYESLQVLAMLNHSNTHDCDYTGDTEICWDTQEPDRADDNTFTVGCENGHNWQTLFEGETTRPTVLEACKAAHTFIGEALIDGVFPEGEAEHLASVLFEAIR